MYYVGGIIKSNPSQSQLYLPKDTGRIHCMLCVCVRMCAYVCANFRAFIPLSFFQHAASHENISLNILTPSKMGKQLLRV